MILIKKQIGPFLLVAALGILFGVFITQKQGEEIPQGASIVDSAAIAQLAEGKNDEEAVRAIAETYSVEAAFEYLKQTYANKQSEAHDLAHVIGYIAYEQRQEDGFGVCDSSFAFGCYHGLVSVLLAEHGLGGISVAQQGCNALATQGDIVSCLHGVGHGLLVWERYDFSTALTECDILEEDDRPYCYDGVFMENTTALMSADGRHVEKVLIKQREDPHWPCSTVEERYKEACYYQQPSALSGRLYGSVADVGAVCADAGKREFTNQCIRGIGVRVGQLANGIPEQAISLCNQLLNDEHRSLCVLYAAQEFTFQKKPRAKVDTLCSSLPSEWKIKCQEETARTRSEYTEGPGESSGSDPKTSPGTDLNARVPEYEEIKKIVATRDIRQQQILYRKLMERVGAEEAQEALYRSGLPFTGETHLLNHEAGYFLYDNEGTKGVVKCKDHFLSSCYHGLLIEAMAEHGLQALSIAMGACDKVGRHVAAQCAHAIGHGLLAKVGYKDLPRALGLCDSVGEQVQDFPLYNCLDGVFMENNYALHLGYPSPDRWINYNDPFYPCNSQQIKEEYRKACWSNQPQMMLEIFRGDFSRLGKLCQEVENEIHRKTCFNSIARHIHSFTNGNPDVAFQMCSLLPEDQYIDCVADNAVSDFSVGGRIMPYQICAQIDEDGKETCYKKLFGSIAAYETIVDFNEECSRITEEKWRRECRERFIK